MKATTIRKSLLCSAIGVCLMGTSAFAADPVVSTTGGLPGYEVIKASPNIVKVLCISRVREKSLCVQERVKTTLMLFL